MEHVLTAEDRAFFDRWGYLVVKGAVPKENCDAVVDDIYTFLQMDPNDTTTWYPPERRGSLAHIHQTQSLWDNRQNPRLYQAFVDLYGTEKLWASLDRACFKPPLSEKYPQHQDNGFVHWDMDTSTPPETWKFFVQAVLCLTDTTEDMGGFCCVPGFHRENLVRWIAEQPEDRHKHQPDLTRLPEGMAVTPIPAEAGDLVIWDVTLAHGNGANHGTAPRLCQYVTLYPAGEDHIQREERIACWQEHIAPTYWSKNIPEPYQGRERALYPEPATLTELGKKLLGLESW
ncbi:phytanoyl-CoA dioxygenase family protein [Armatimonas sp.]|uniref:phytanoyl-CoA dioxygenase family protein n=1 Tax=Armatimonas sp. TaxID=1872638 RepID=UPI00374DE07C